MSAEREAAQRLMAAVNDRGHGSIGELLVDPVIVGEGPADGEMGRGMVYLPLVMTAPNRTAECFGHAAAYEFYQLLSEDERQLRPRLDCCPALVTAAAWRAAALVAGPWGHCDGNGVWANDYARRAGCVLPADYGAGNNIESIAAGSPDARAIFEALARSKSHSDHLFGRGDFFLRQTRIGIAVAAGGRYGWYWSVLIAQCEVRHNGD